MDAPSGLGRKPFEMLACPPDVFRPRLEVDALPEGVDPDLPVGVFHALSLDFAAGRPDAEAATMAAIMRS